MDMKNQPSREFRVDLQHVEGFQFRSQASEEDRNHGSPYLSDEPDPVGAASGPSTPALLASAIGHCLSSSLLDTLLHARIPIEDFRTEATAVVIPNAAGQPRIHHVEVVLRPTLLEPTPRTGRCEEVFQKHCTITSSVREGIDVQVRVEWDYRDATSSPSDQVSTSGEEVIAHRS
jgi:organic hydroperoxide reductase OsmC/OhrA